MGSTSDNEPTRPPGFSPLVGVQGANNGLPVDSTQQPNHEGETSKAFQVADSSSFNDEDWAAVHPNLTANSGDPAVLQFEVELDRPGFIRASFSFGSDEYPAWFSNFNDTVAILIKGPFTPTNEPGENIATFVRNGAAEPFSLAALVGCPPLFIKNQMSPAALAAFPNSEHKIQDPPSYQTYYDHEFGGFSRVLTRETSTALAPGTYTIKFVIQDVADRLVDAALFIPSSSVKFFPLAGGDYNGSGCVDQADYDVWRAHFGQTPASFYDGDGNGDCVVDAADYVTWRRSVGTSGNTDFRADFNRDGTVDSTDTGILEQFQGFLDECASRFEGDADGDGDVDETDFNILGTEFELTSCGCNCGGESLMAGGGVSLAELKEQLPESADADGDGDVDDDDLAMLDAIVAGSGGELESVEADAAESPSPTLAE